LSTNRKIQYPVYFISVVLKDLKTWYFHIMKLDYALLITSYKFSHYFQAHQTEVHTSSTFCEILNNKEATGKIAKWVIELSMYRAGAKGVWEVRLQSPPPPQKLGAPAQMQQ
jgi:hypothetical protein